MPIFPNCSIGRVCYRSGDGDAVDPAEVDPKTYDPRTAAKDPELSPSPRTRTWRAFDGARNMPLSIVMKKGETIDQVVLPIYGKGLWSTLYGFLALDIDATTVRGITFYEHAETPGLGGEIDNPRWKTLWNGKKIFDDQGEMKIEVVKGAVPGTSASGPTKSMGSPGPRLPPEEFPIWFATGWEQMALALTWISSAGALEPDRNIRLDAGQLPEGCEHG